MRIVVGSTAGNHWFEDFPRSSKDVDLLIGPHDVSLDVLGVTDIRYDECRIEAGPWSAPARADIEVNSSLASITAFYATPQELYTVKVSHSYWDLPNGSWDKHIYDILFFQGKGLTVRQDLHDQLYKAWELRYGKKEVNLSYESDRFFRDAVKRVYDHDSIHHSVAYGDTAMYLHILKDGATVDIDNNKLWGLSHDDRVKLFREEIAATALERWMIPSGYKFSPRRAWKLALKKTIVSLTKGRSAQFIVENYSSFMTPCDYVSRHLKNKERLIKL